MNSRTYLILAVLAFLLSNNTQGQNLSLADALTLASSNNPELKASQLEIERAQQQRTIARSFLLPSVSANALANHYFDLPAFFGFGTNAEGGKIPYGRFGGKDQLSTYVSAVQPLFNPMAFPALHEAQIQLQHKVVAAKAKQLDILSQIKTRYLQILVLQERIRLQQESINRNKRVLQDSRSLFIQGKGLRVDTLRAYTSVKNLEPDLVKLSFLSETAKLELKALIGVDSLADFTLTDSLTVPTSIPNESEQQVLEDVRLNNPELQLLKLQEQIERQQIKVSSALRKPTLSLVAQYQIQSQTNDFEYSNAHYPSSSYVGLQLSVPLFAGFSTQAKVKQARIERDQSQLLVQNKQAQLTAQVHQAIANLRESSLRVENTAIVQQTAKVSYNIIQYRYKSGISSRLELTDAELALSTAQSNYLEAVYDYLAASIALDKIKGKIEL
ncbi:TolC family protein [Chryseosolibacter indicus]|uniref:TolC family protein n=1 Tax=Chryseosolibacter indicus TaxID=2782351 RepID=A0ABS5VRL8_9BACT|nr:TolC family protein [Chryseosolibacter indicus]MBT1703673.1 TolC family protein [Chryseosolibacter indicus]